MMGRPLVGLADNDISELIAALRSGRLAPPFSPLSVQRYVPHSTASALAGDLQQLGSHGFTVDQISILLEVLKSDRSNRPNLDDAIDLVTTGPDVAGVTNRDTAVVVRELFANAEHSVLIAGYAVYQGRRLFEALADRMQQRPELKVRLFLDVARGPGDPAAASEIVQRFAQRFKTLQWPADRALPETFYDPRSLESGIDNRSSMHAKCLVVDRETVFVSSANFTERAQERNIEIGLLVRSALLAERLTAHFNALLDGKVFEPISWG